MVIHEKYTLLNSLSLMVLWDNRNQIFTDIKAALRVLESVTVKSKTVEDCRIPLKMMAKQFSLNLVRVSGKVRYRVKRWRTSLHGRAVSLHLRHCGIVWICRYAGYGLKPLWHENGTKESHVTLSRLSVPLNDFCRSYREGEERETLEE